MQTTKRLLIIFTLSMTAQHEQASSPFRSLEPIHHSAKNTEQWKEVKHAFSTYNKKVSDQTVDKFLEVAQKYELDKEGLFEQCINHICLESGAKQSARSPTGAVGISQIVPTTAYDILHRVTKEEFAIMAELGAESIDWALDGSYSSRDDGDKKRLYIDKRLRAKAIAWLEDADNNLILWGFIMHERLQTMRPQKAFLAYRLGKGGANSYKGNIGRHPYIRGMEKITSVLHPKKKGGVI